MAPKTATHITTISAHAIAARRMAKLPIEGPTRRVPRVLRLIRILAALSGHFAAESMKCTVIVVKVANCGNLASLVALPAGP